MRRRFEHIFFDLDGTVLDSAPGLLEILNTLRARHRLGALALDEVRPSISYGINAILDTGFTPTVLARHRSDLHASFAELYQQDCCRGASLFPGFELVVERLGRLGIPWSVISNKRAELSRRIMAHFGLERRAAFVLGGDSLGRSKPDAEPLRHICERAGIEPRKTAMIGDNINDIGAARACGATSVLALWGYLPAPRIWRGWGADRSADSLPATLCLLNR